ncbi:MAG: hypothetical protein HPY69_05615 [Armatimonadetes bacterium]|nr:hypothetical protein [Armatimonadota bacterium]
MRYRWVWCWLSLCAFGLSTGGANAITALERLQSADQPRFRPGHTLPPLTRWGWTMPYDVRVELARNWGYALEFGGYVTDDAADALNDPQSEASRLCTLAASDPKRYALFVLVAHGQFGEVPDSAWTHDASGALPDGQKIWSPEAPDSIFADAGRRWAAPIARVRAKAPISMVLNGGEYAMSVYGFGGKAWSADPKVIAARGDRDWYDYLSERKAHQELIIAEAVRAAVPGRRYYLYYYTDGCPHRNRFPDWWQWAYDYKYMRPVSDIPNGSIYYNHFNSGWTGDNDMLTQALNSVAQQISYGDPLSYNWMNAGWKRESLGEAAIGDSVHYMGYLKCYYTAGMIGGVAGYFAYPVETDPACISQMMVLGQAHALFSHLEEFLRHGDLLPGPNRHRWSTDLPAYEFPTGDPEVRVLARRHRTRPEWLVTAWAAGGPDRQVWVEIPQLGRVRLRARDCGSVYRAVLDDGRPRLRLVDVRGMWPSAGL